ncbi:MAG: rod-binding protein [Pseudomonadota bacterium]
MDAANTVAPGGLGPVGSARTDVATLENQAIEFEAMFLHQMLSAMRQGADEDNPLGGPESPFGSMLQAEQARLIARAGGIGVADTILNELLKLQEAS